jgi:hypothetical protein
MRNTVHLLTAEDFVSFRPLFQPFGGPAGAARDIRFAPVTS